MKKIAYVTEIAILTEELVNGIPISYQEQYYPSYLLMQLLLNVIASSSTTSDQTL